jgi:YggT family protein
MFVVGNALSSVATLIGTIAQIYVFVLIGYVIVSWVHADQSNPIVRFIHTVSDPFLARIRRFVPPIAGLDFSVLIAILIVQIGIQGFVVTTLMDWARQLR